MSTDATGRLVTSAGNIVQPPITIPTNATSINIANDGTVSVQTPASPTPKVLGQIQLATFPNQEGLLQEGGNLFSETAASGAAVTGIPGQGVFGSLQQDSLEQSNVDVTTELTQMVVTQQAYTANSKVVTTTNQMVGIGALTRSRSNLGSSSIVEEAHLSPDLAKLRDAGCLGESFSIAQWRRRHSFSQILLAT